MSIIVRVIDIIIDNDVRYIGSDGLCIKCVCSIASETQSRNVEQTGFLRVDDDKIVSPR